jgi:glyoxylase-like metal-dependent hydrolase (beta-lactamase superfamily II)
MPGPVSHLMQTIPIHARNPGPFTGAGNWTWLIPGRLPTLVDAGTGDPAHLDELEQQLSGVPILQILVTHGHPDHASGAPAIRARWPAARFAKMPWRGRDDRWPVPWHALADGDLVAAGETELRVVHTPGHAPDHLCFWHAPTRTIFGGDLVIAGTSVWIPSGADGDLAAYLASLERIRALGPDRLLPAHGPIVDDPESLLLGYLAHRQARERQVLDALRLGDTTPEAITRRLYPDAPDRVRPLAQESVTAHLVKLERDGRVRRTGEAWHII